MLCAGNLHGGQISYILQVTGEQMADGGEISDIVQVTEGRLADGGQISSIPQVTGMRHTQATNKIITTAGNGDGCESALSDDLRGPRAAEHVFRAGFAGRIVNILFRFRFRHDDD